MTEPQIEQWIQVIAWERIPFALVVVVVAWALIAASGRLLDNLALRFNERRLAFKQAKALVRMGTYVLAPIVVFSAVLRLESESFYAVAGTLAVALGFAFKDLAGSLIAGVILLMDRPFQVGDRISFGGFYGEVQEMGLRSVRLVTLDDNLVTIPNNKFLTDEVASANAGELDAMVVVPFYVGAAEDFEKARAIIAEATSTSRYVYLKKPITTLVEDKFLGERFVTVITAKAYVFDVRYEKSLVTDVTERVKVAFRKQGIRTPDQQYRDLDLNDREAVGTH
ncbi:MAG: mechanosensitive ion channel domain-containing protein [Myxococcota bacterium]